jgi:nucleoid-associated protein YgaU
MGTVPFSAPATAASNSTLIQVSDREQVDHDHAHMVPDMVPGPGPGKLADTRVPAADDARHRAPHDDSFKDMAADPSAPRSPYAVPPPAGDPAFRRNGDPALSAPGREEPRNYSGIAPGDAPSSYSTGPSGYGRDDSATMGTRYPAGGDSPAPMPVRNRFRNDGTYEVQPNDSFWTISEKVYGSGAYFRALAEQNRGKAARPDRLPPGLVISTPPIAQLEKDYADLCPRPNHREAVRQRGDLRAADGYAGHSGAAAMTVAGGPASGYAGRTYVVQEGDTLSSIARHELRKVSRWAEIYQLNREALGKDYDYVTPGMRLVLPITDAPSGDRVTRRSGDPLR